MSATTLRLNCPICELALAAPVASLRAERVVVVCPKCAHRWHPHAAPGVDSGPLRCSAHPEREASWVCDDCGGAWCEDCDERERGQTVGNLRVSTCCLARRLPVTRVEAARPFWEDLPAVMLWPLRRAGLPMLLIFWAGSFIPFVSWFLQLILAAYLQHVLRTSARGAPHLPPYPEVDEPVQDVVYPLGRFLAVTVVLWFPWWFARVFLGAPAPLLALLALPGAVLWPFAVTVASVGRSLRGLTDLPLLAAVLSRIRVDYAAALGVLATLAAAVALLELASSKVVGLGLLASLLRYYALFAGFHVLGLMVLQTRHAVEWEV
jgi:hypothetical protein